MEVVAEAPTVVKLFGEHAVVYGTKALAASVNRYVRVRARVADGPSVRVFSRDIPCIGAGAEVRGEDVRVFGDEKSIVRGLAYVIEAVKLVKEVYGVRNGAELFIESEVQPGAGLGTSAAVSVATIAAYASLCGIDIEKRELAKLAREVEVRVQGAASPMDTGVATYGGFVLVNPRGDEVLSPVKAGAKINVVIGCVKKEKNTGEIVAAVRELRRKLPAVIDAVIEAIAKVVEEGVKALEEGDVERLGKLMLVNHGLLKALNVVNKPLDDMVHAAVAAGALGAKMSGAGCGGCVIALVTDDACAERVSTAMRLVGASTFRAELGVGGVRLFKK